MSDHRHNYTRGHRFKWLTGHWYRRYFCICGSTQFKRETT